MSVVNVGTTPNDGTGDDLRTAFTAINAKFDAVDEQLAHRIDVTKAPYNADPTGSTSSVSAFRDADAAAYAAGKRLYAPAGTYLFDSPFSGSAAPYTPPRASWEGDPGRTRIRITHANSLRTFRSLADDTTEQRAQSRTGTINTGVTAYDAYAIADVPAGQGWVQFSTLGDLAASGIVAGDIVHVAGGMNVQDADDDLWYYDQLHRVAKTDSGTGKVWLEDAVDLYLTSNGWDGAGAGKNIAPYWANAVAKTAGDYVYDDAESLYVALTSGITSGTAPTNDTGVTWHAVTTSLTLQRDAFGTCDFRPIIQKAPCYCKDMVWSGLVFEWTNQGGQPGIVPRSVYNWAFLDCSFVGRNVYVTEASRHVTFDRCMILLPPGANNEARSAIDVYQARKITARKCVVTGGGVGTFASGANYLFHMESYGELILDDCHGSINDREASNTSNIAYIDRGEVHIKGGTWLGAKDPIRMNTVVLAEEPWQHDVTMTGALLQLDSTAFRSASDAEMLPAWFNASNRYLVRAPYSSGGYVQDDHYFFRPHQLVHIPVTFTPATNQTATAITVDPAVLQQHGIYDATKVSLVLLAASGYWASSTANSVDVRLQAKQVGTSTVRNLMSTTSTSNRLVLNSTTPRARLIQGDGTGVRLMQAGIDDWGLNYYSGASAGGTVTVVLTCLVEIRTAVRP